LRSRGGLSSDLRHPECPGSLANAAGHLTPFRMAASAIAEIRDGGDSFSLIRQAYDGPGGTNDGLGVR